MTRTLRFAAPLAATIFMLPAVVSSASKDGEFAIKDAGLAPCENYIAARAKVTAMYGLYLGWIGGYLSAYNRLAEDTLDIAPWQTTELLAGFLYDYCKENPKISFAQAVNNLVDHLKLTRLQTGSEKITATARAESVTVYRAVMRRAQERLAQLSYYKGAIDGLYQKESREAFEAFQRDKGIPVTGLPDLSTLYALFR